MDVSLQLQQDPVAVQTETHLDLLVELTAPTPTADRSRESLRITVVVDRSGSMHGAKLEATKRSIAYLAGQLTAEDRLAVIAYDSKVTHPYPLAPVDTGRSAGRWPVSAPVGGRTCRAGGSRVSSSCVASTMGSVGWCCCPKGMPKSVLPRLRRWRGWLLRWRAAGSRPRPSGSVTDSRTLGTVGIGP